MESKRTYRDWIWPNVNTPAGAVWATQQAFAAAAICAVLTSVMSLLGVIGVQSLEESGFGYGSLLDATVFAMIAFGLWRQSSFAAWSGLLFYCFERLGDWILFDTKGLLISFAFLFAFIAGVRGTVALRRMKQSNSIAPSVP
jgi:hypothetical protein